MLFAAFICFLTVAAIAAAAIACSRGGRPEALPVALPIVLVGYGAVVFVFNQFEGVPIAPALILAASGGIAALLLAAALVVVGPPAKWWTNIKASLAALSPRGLTPSARFVGALLLVGAGLLALTVVFSVPPDWDAYFYHLPISQYILEHHSLPGIVSLSYQEMVNAYPPASFIFYGSSWITLGARAVWLAQITSFLYGLGILFFTYRIARRFVAKEETSSILAALLLVSFYSVAFILISTNTDTAYNFFNISGLYFLLEYFESRRPSSLALSTILEACGCWSKYQAAIFVAVLGFVWLGFWFASATFLRRRKGDVAFPIGGALLWGTGILVLFAPFLLRNFLKFGNPLYPALPHLLGGIDVSGWTLSWLTASAQLLPYSPGQVTLRHAPSIMLFAGLFLLPAAIGYLVPRFKSASSYLLATALLFGVTWYKFMTPENSGDFFRFLIPGLCIASCLCAPLISALLFDETEARPRQNLLVLLCLVSAVLLFIDLGIPQFSTPEFVFSVSKKYGALGTAINYMLTYNKYHHFVIFIVGTAVLVALSYLRTHPDYLRAGRAYRRAVAAVMVFSLLLYPAARLVGTVNVAVRAGVSLDLQRSYYLGEVGAYINDELQPDSKILSFVSQRFLIGRPVVAADSILVRTPIDGEIHGIFDTTSPERKFFLDSPRDQYTDADIRRCLGILKEEGITHILLDNVVDEQDLFLKSPVFANVEHDPRYFKLRAWGPNGQERFISLYEISYPPDAEVRR